MGKTQAAAKVSFATEWAAGPLVSIAGQIEASVAVLWWPEIGACIQTQLLAKAGNVAVRQAGAMAIDMRVVQASAIALERQAIG